MVVFPIKRLVDLANEQTMIMMVSSSLQQPERAMILASIINRAVFVCNFDCHNTGHSAKVDESFATLYTSESKMILMTIL